MIWFDSSGAGPVALITETFSLGLSNIIMNPSPPIPDIWGSTTPSIKLTAQAASNAFPPLFKMSLPTIEANQWFVTTEALNPTIFGLIEPKFFPCGRLCVIIP